MSLEFSDSPLSATPGGWPIAMLCLCRLTKQTACVLCEAINNTSRSGLLAQIELLAMLTFSITAYLNRCHNFLTRLPPSVPIVLKCSFRNELLKHTPEHLFKKFIIPLTYIKKKKESNNKKSCQPASPIHSCLPPTVFHTVLRRS